MKNNKIYLLGLNLQKNIQVLTDSKIKYDKELVIDDQYTIIVFTYDQVVYTNSDKERQVMHLLNEHHLSLYELNVEDFYKYESLFLNQEDRQVFFHCLHEHHRMNQIEEILQTLQYDKLGRLMKDSYNSYKYYYHITTQKQDYLMLLAEKHHAVSANISDNHLVCLIETNKKQMFINNMTESFKTTYGKPLNIEVNHD